MLSKLPFNLKYLKKKSLSYSRKKFQVLIEFALVHLIFVYQVNDSKK